MAEAGRKMGVDKASIQRVFSGKQKTAGGFHWEKEIKQKDILEELEGKIGEA